MTELGRAASAVLLGPGLTGAAAGELVAKVLPELFSCVVLDTLGMAAVTENPTCVHHLDERCVLTPNRHELALTLGLDEVRWNTTRRPPPRS